MSKHDPHIGKAKALKAQKHQVEKASRHFSVVGEEVANLSANMEGNESLLDDLIADAENMLARPDIVVNNFDSEISEQVFFGCQLENDVAISAIPEIEAIDLGDSDSWELYLDKVEAYALVNGVDISNPYKGLMSQSQELELERRIKEEFSYKSPSCDKYDYMIAGTAGLLAGIVDVLFVGVPGKGGLTSFTDDMANKSVERFAKINGWKGPREGKDSVASAIGFLERKYKVNYDHRHGGDVDGLFKMSTKNHHIKNLAHSPDLVGLFFSLLDQFTSTAHFVDEGRLISIDTDTFELKGGNFLAKGFSGFVNWLGHLFSDLAGSSGAIERGSGIPIPFFSLLQFMDFGEFGQHKQTFAKVSVQVFEQGYDFRHGMALSIPVLIAELITRIGWVAKRKFYHEEPWSNCLPSASNPELRRMLLVAHGSLCLVDATDATLKSGGDIIQFMLRSNIIAWARFGTLALKELRCWYQQGSLDPDAVDEYIDAELERMLAA